MVQWMSDNSLFKRNKFMTRKKPQQDGAGKFPQEPVKGLTDVP